MNPLWKYKRVGLIAICAGLLTACIAPIEEVERQMDTDTQTVSESNKAIEKRKVVTNKARDFVCKNKKEVRIIETIDAKNNKNVTLTFNGVSHKLSSAVTKLGKKYSNIRWVWKEDLKGQGTLRDNRNKILAEKCYQK
ncbi:hypothetical protein A1D22_05125 [Pasteurellaceae bacterium LFhippo2]|nr:hypothetical protein [Pasteurellaceae bacterium LFhippo2]